MRNCVVFFCGSSSPFHSFSPRCCCCCCACGFLSLSFNCEFVELTQSQQSTHTHTIHRPSLTPLPLCDRGACENAPAYHSHCLLNIFVSLLYVYCSLFPSLSFTLSLQPILRLLVQVLIVCFVCLSSFSLLMLLLSFLDSFFWPTDSTSSIAVIHSLLRFFTVVVSSTSVGELITSVFVVSVLFAL